MTTPKPAHREFWIIEYSENSREAFVAHELDDKESGTTHVIEFSRVLELEQEVQGLKSEAGQLVLKFAAMKNIIVSKEILETENAQLKAEVERLSQLDYSKEDERRRDGLVNAKNELTEARAEIERLCQVSPSKNLTKIEAELLITNKNSSSLVDELAKAKSHELTTAVFAVDEKLREELAALKAELSAFKDIANQRGENYQHIKAERDGLREALKKCKNMAYGAACTDDQTIFQIIFEDARVALKTFGGE